MNRRRIAAVLCVGALGATAGLVRTGGPGPHTPSAVRGPILPDSGPTPAPVVEAPGSGATPPAPRMDAPSPLPDDVDGVRTWARTDPARALAWLAHAVPGPGRDAALEIVSAEVAQFDPAQSVALVEQWTSGNLPLLENLVHPWALRDPAAATAYAAARPPGEMRNRLLARVALARAQTDPAAAARQVVEEIPAGAVHEEAVISVLYQWARRDAAGALAWVSDFPPGALRERALQELAITTPPP